jgi:phenylpropionate dioxygenase-like ring-hydroxylating dioxygenase large terminal subunit
MSLNNKYYIEKKYFDIEKELFQEEALLLVAHKNELNNSNDFITLDYLEEKIFIQNFNGKLKCFLNICLHRLNTINEEDFGNRMALCLYHYWLYDKEGKVAGLNCRNSFVDE